MTPYPVLNDEISDVAFTDESQEFRIRSMYLVGRLLPYFEKGESADAILATNDHQAYEIRAACISLGCTSDASVWVTGYDNFYKDIADAMSSFNLPIPAATVDKRNFELGKETGSSVDRADNRLAADKNSSAKDCARLCSFAGPSRGSLLSLLD